MTDLAVSLWSANVQTARHEHLAKDIALLTSLSVSAVHGRLRRAHGRTLLRNLFKDVWPARDRPTPKATSPSGTRQRRARRDQHTVHRVRQEETTSCGVAAVAMFARVTHAAAMRVMFPRARKTFYTHYTDIRRGLDHFEVPHGGRHHRFKCWDEIPTTSLVKVKCHVGSKTYFHWVIFQRKADGSWRVLDPGVSAGTLTLDEGDVDWYTGLSYMAVEAKLPRAVSTRA